MKSSVTPLLGLFLGMTLVFTFYIVGMILLFPENNIGLGLGFAGIGAFCFSVFYSKLTDIQNDIFKLNQKQNENNVSEKTK